MELTFFFSWTWSRLKKTLVVDRDVKTPFKAKAEPAPKSNDSLIKVLCLSRETGKIHRAANYGNSNTRSKPATFKLQENLMMNKEMFA